jgi:KipI family sensor histidine kinase inhibitor
VSASTGLSADEVIARHIGRTYTVDLLGFVPGFGYLSELDTAIQLPRRSQPRLRVPAGSVAIAGAQTAVYPLDTPGGWHIIGRTDRVMFDPSRDPPALLRAGDKVRFVRAT